MMYAIRQKSTGYYLPPKPTKFGSSATYQEPRADCVPRLFRRAQDAKLALMHWLEGEQYDVVHHDDNPNTGPDTSIQRVVHAAPHRKAEDMEIVPVTVMHALHVPPPLPADRYTTDLYFEAHVTLEPFNDERLFRLLQGLCAEHDFRVADFTMAHADAPVPKPFLSCRDTDYARIERRVLHMVEIVLRHQPGLNVTRWKIENTLRDTNRNPDLLTRPQA